MSKMLTPVEMAKIVNDLCVSDVLDDSDVYKKFLYGLADLITDFCGGVPASVSYEGDCGWLVGFSIDSCVPPDGGVFKEHDPDVEWKGGEEV